MKINVIRKLDYYLGPVFCNILLFLRFLFGPTVSQNHIRLIKEPKNILIIKFFGMGTILLASPALRELKKKYKSAKITIFTLPSNRELCKMLPSIDRVICLDIGRASDFLRSFARAIFDIRKRDFDVVIDLEFLTNFSALVTLLVTLFDRTKIIVGFSSPLKWRNSVHNINVSFDHSRHITKIFAKMVRGLTEQAFQASFELEKAALLKKMDTGYIKRLMRANNNLARCNFYICVNINAGELSLHRRWPKEYFAKIVNELIKRPNVAILLIGSGADVEYVSEFKSSLPQHLRIIDVCGKTNIKELIGLFSRCNLLITNDGGPLHLAEVAGLATISFFGPETPYLYAPLDKKHYVFYEDLYCSPCLNIYNSKMSSCKNNICLKSIKPEGVLKIIEDNYLPS